MKHFLLLHLDCPGAASMQEHALCHSLQKRESVICSCYKKEENETKQEASTSVCMSLW